MPFVPGGKDKYGKTKYVHVGVCVTCGRCGADRRQLHKIAKDRYLCSVCLRGIYNENRTLIPARPQSVPQPPTYTIRPRR